MAENVTDVRAELAEIKAQHRELCIGVLDGTVERGDAIAGVQLYNARLRAVELMVEVRRRKAEDPELDQDGLGAADAAMPRN